MNYAYLPLARDGEARKTWGEARTVTGLTGIAAGPYALAAMPARYALERGDWRGAAKLEPSPSKYPYTEAMTHFARALGAARSGDPAAARQDIERIAALRDELKAAKSEYWANEVEVMRLASLAWVSLAQKRATRPSASCAKPPTSRTGVRRISSRRGACCPRGRCSATCCSTSSVRRGAEGIRGVAAA